MLGDAIKDLWLAVYSDASFAGDTGDSKSTTGWLLCLVGPKSFVPLNWLCKKQTVVSHSSTEAEIVALDTMIHMEGTPTLNLWSQVVDVVNGTANSGVVAKSKSESAYRKYDSVSLELCDYVPFSLPSLLPYTRF